jgi:hypothetical protein
MPIDAGLGPEPILPKFFDKGLRTLAAVDHQCSGCGYLRLHDITRCKYGNSCLSMRVLESEPILKYLTKLCDSGKWDHQSRGCRDV